MGAKGVKQLRREPRDETRAERCFEFETRCRGVLKGFVWASGVDKAKQKLNRGEYQVTLVTPNHIVIGDDLVLQRREDLEPVPEWKLKERARELRKELGEEE